MPKGGRARAIWTGSLSFGLVNVPVGLFSATEDHDVHFHQFEKGTSNRVRNKRVNERTGDEVDYDDVVKGAEIDAFVMRGKDLTMAVNLIEAMTSRWAPKNYRDTTPSG